MHVIYVNAAIILTELNNYFSLRLGRKIIAVLKKLNNCYVKVLLSGMY